MLLLIMMMMMMIEMVMTARSRVGNATRDIFFPAEIKKSDLS